MVGEVDVGCFVGDGVECDVEFVFVGEGVDDFDL